MLHPLTCAEAALGVGQAMLKSASYYTHYLLGSTYYFICVTRSDLGFLRRTNLARFAPSQVLARWLKLPGARHRGVGSP